MLNPNNKPPPTRPPEQALKIYRELGDSHGRPGRHVRLDQHVKLGFSKGTYPKTASIQFVNYNILPRTMKIPFKTDWWFGTFFFPYIGKIIPTDQYFKGVVRISGKVPCMGQTPPFQWATEPRMTSSTSGKTLGRQWGNPIKNHAHYNLPEILTESSSCGLPIVFHVYT